MKPNRSRIYLIALMATLLACAARPALAAGLDDSLKSYWLGKTSEALDSIRAYQKEHPDDPKARLWKTIIRIEWAMELRNSDKETSKRIALNEWETFWSNNSADEDSDTVSGNLMLYRLAEAKVYWLNNRQSRSYKAMKEDSKMKSPIPETLHFKGVMEQEGYLAGPFSTDAAEQVASAEAAIKSFKEELSLIGKSTPEASLRSAYWIARSTCSAYRLTSPAKLSKIFEGVEIDIPGSVYRPLVNAMLEKGCP